jgi:hypothetical protein
MKLLMFLNLFFVLPSFSQVKETIVLKKENAYIIPNIEGVSDGEISILKLGSKNGLQAPNNIQITSFLLEYPSGSGFKSIQVLNNIIPDTTLIDIRKSCLNEQLFFTNIRALSSEKIQLILPSISLIPILKDEE